MPGNTIASLSCSTVSWHTGEPGTWYPVSYYRGESSSHRPGLPVDLGVAVARWKSGDQDTWYGYRTVHNGTRVPVSRTICTHRGLTGSFPPRYTRPRRP